MHRWQQAAQIQKLVILKSGITKGRHDKFSMGKYNIKSKTGKFTCPFFKGRKKQEYEFDHLAQHARGTGGFGSRSKAKVKAKHLALAMYLDDWLEEALGSQQNCPGPDYDEMGGGR